MQISECREVVRFLLGDNDASLQAFSDAALDGGVKSILRLRAVPGMGVAPNGTEFSPAPSADQFALVCLHTARGFRASEPDGYSWRSRAAGETIRGWRTALADLEDRIYALERGDGFISYALFSNWLVGMGGLPLAEHLTEMTGSPGFTRVSYPLAE